MRAIDGGGAGGARGRVAVVGGGIAGLASAWLLSQRYRVTLFEAGSYVGGHTNTIDVTVEGRSHPVDTGFLVFNRRTYPNLCALFGLLGVAAVDSEMTFSVSLESPALEWAGTDLDALFAQRRNLVRPAFLGMLRDIARFNRETIRMLAGGTTPSESLGEYLARERYGAAFRDWYLLPMAAAIWSCPTRSMLAYPLATFVRFCHNHGLLQVSQRPQWLTVRGGGREYVRRIVAQLDDVRVACPVLCVNRCREGALVINADGAEHFDQVVFACHSDQALALLGDGATGHERRVLGAIRYQDNTAVVHTDTALLPRRRKVWSAWNYLAGGGAVDARPVSVSYLLNRLQPLPFETPLVVSLNPHRPPRASAVLRTLHYAHPVFDQGAIDAQAALPQIQGRRGIWFAGAWTGYGFHEDGLKSAMDVASALGARIPWQTAQPAGVAA